MLAILSALPQKLLCQLPLMARKPHICCVSGASEEVRGKLFILALTTRMFVAEQEPHSPHFAAPLPPQECSAMGLLVPAEAFACCSDFISGFTPGVTAF